jgi:hypothetical protein
MTTPIFQQSTSFFDTSSAPNEGIIPLQSDPAGPQVSGVERATNMLLPDAPTMQQLRNFPEELYDLRETSTLVRLMKVLLGDAGAGQLRKRTLVTRLEAALSGANFFDLDRFYGAIFGALRNQSEVLEINPMDQVATPDEWDDIQAADASYRERIAELARAIAMGGTIPGLRQAAEAIVQAPVDIYESWQLIDAYGAVVTATPNTWDETQTLYPTWQSFPSTSTWNAVEGTVQVGRTNTLTRSEIVVRPQKDYTSSQENLYNAPREENALVRVLQKLRPAGTIVTVDLEMGDPHVETPISGLKADSEFWEIVPKVMPKTTLVGDTTAVYPLSVRQAAQLAASSPANGGITPPVLHRVIPRPPWASGQGRIWTYNSAISAVTSYTFAPPDAANVLDAQDGTPSTTTDDQTVVYRDSTSVTYTARKGVLGAQQALAAGSVSDGSLVAHPYTGDRKAVPSHE